MHHIIKLDVERKMGPPPKTQKMYEHGMSVNNSEKNTYQRTAKRVSTKCHKISGTSQAVNLQLTKHLMKP